MRSLVASLCRDDITAAQPLLVILSTVLVILSAALVILSTVLVILSTVLVILSVVEGSLFPKLQSCREILRFALLSQDDIAVARLDGTQARHPERPICHPERPICHPERPTCHPEHSTCHPEHSTCHPERSRRISVP